MVRCLVQQQSVQRHLISCLMLLIVIVFTVLTSTKMLSVRRVVIFHSSTAAFNFYQNMKTAENVVVSPIVVWQISITVLLHLCKDLHNNWFKFLLRNQLNQDCLENLFSIIRGKGGFGDNPDPQKFIAAFRHVIVDKIFVHSTSTNVHWMQIKYC